MKRLLSLILFTCLAFSLACVGGAASSDFGDEQRSESVVAKAEQESSGVSEKALQGEVEKEKGSRGGSGSTFLFGESLGFLANLFWFLPLIL